MAVGGRGIATSSFEEGSSSSDPGPVAAADEVSLSLGSGTQVAGSHRYTGRERGLWQNWSGCCGSIPPTGAVWTKTMGIVMSCRGVPSPSPDSCALTDHWTGDVILTRD